MSSLPFFYTKQMKKTIEILIVFALGVMLLSCIAVMAYTAYVMVVLHDHLIGNIIYFLIALLSSFYLINEMRSTSDLTKSIFKFEEEEPYE